jgi:predicted transcriptional regulator of viral defense system
MKTLTEKIIESQLVNRVFNDAELGRVLGGSKARRYGLVNRALKAGELLRVKRGLYVLANKYRDYALHPFALAQALTPGSYVSLETALAYHGWIPEAVYTTASILPGRKFKEYEHEELGYFTFHPLATNKGYFLELVERLKIDEQTMLVAEPIRALMDLVCLKKVKWQGISWLVEGLRIDPDNLRKTTRADIRILKEVYKHKNVKEFLNALAMELGND